MINVDSPEAKGSVRHEPAHLALATRSHARPQSKPVLPLTGGLGPVGTGSPIVLGSSGFSPLEVGRVESQGSVKLLSSFRKQSKQKIKPKNRKKPKFNLTEAQRRVREMNLLSQVQLRSDQLRNKKKATTVDMSGDLAVRSSSMKAGPQKAPVETLSVDQTKPKHLDTSFASMSKHLGPVKSPLAQGPSRPKEDAHSGRLPRLIPGIPSREPSRDNQDDDENVLVYEKNDPLTEDSPIRGQANLELFQGKSIIKLNSSHQLRQARLSHSGVEIYNVGLDRPKSSFSAKQSHTKRIQEVVDVNDLDSKKSVDQVECDEGRRKKDIRIQEIPQISLIDSDQHQKSFSSKMRPNSEIRQNSLFLPAPLTSSSLKKAASQGFASKDKSFEPRDPSSETFSLKPKIFDSNLKFSYESKKLGRTRGHADHKQPDRLRRMQSEPHSGDASYARFHRNNLSFSNNADSKRVPASGSNIICDLIDEKRHSKPPVTLQFRRPESNAKLAEFKQADSGGRGKEGTASANENNLIDLQKEPRVDGVENCSIIEHSQKLSKTASIGSMSRRGTADKPGSSQQGSGGQSINSLASSRRTYLGIYNRFHSSRSSASEWNSIDQESISRGLGVARAVEIRDYMLPEMILNHRRHPKTKVKEYLIKLRKCPPENSIWVPVSDVTNKFLIYQYRKDLAESKPYESLIERRYSHRGFNNYDHFLLALQKNKPEFAESLVRYKKSNLLKQRFGLSKTVEQSMKRNLERAREIFVSENHLQPVKVVKSSGIHLRPGFQKPVQAPAVKAEPRSKFPGVVGGFSRPAKFEPVVQTKLERPPVRRVRADTFYKNRIVLIDENISVAPAGIDLVEDVTGLRPKKFPFLKKREKLTKISDQPLKFIEVDQEARAEKRKDQSEEQGETADQRSKKRQAQEARETQAQEGQRSQKDTEPLDQKDTTKDPERTEEAVGGHTEAGPKADEPGQVEPEKKTEKSQNRAKTEAKEALKEDRFETPQKPKLNEEMMCYGSSFQKNQFEYDPANESVDYHENSESEDNPIEHDRENLGKRDHEKALGPEAAEGGQAVKPKSETNLIQLN